MSDFVPTNQFPLVPNAPGVPPVPRAPADFQAAQLLEQAQNGVVSPTLQAMFDGETPSMLNGLGGIPLNFLSDAVTAPPLVSADAASVGDIAAPAQWGVYDKGGQIAIKADVVVGVEYRKEHRVSDYPQEDGSFQSYNKVERPYEIRVTLARAGKADDRTSFLDAIDTVQKSLDLYTVVTPEKTYSNANLTHVDLPRTAEKGVTMLRAELWFEEIRVSGSATFTNTKIPAGQDAADDGNVQPQTPSPSQEAAIDNPAPF